MNQTTILDAIAQAKERGISIEELKQQFSIDTTADLINIMKELNALMESYVIALNSKQRYVLAKYKNIYTGILRLNKKGFGFVEIDDSTINDIYVGVNDIHQAMNKDKVVVEVFASYDSTFGRILKILERGSKFFVGTARQRQNQWILETNDEKIQLPIYIADAEVHHLIDGHRIKLDITEYHDQKLVGTVAKILGHENEPGIDVLSILTEYEIIPEFNDAVMAEIQKMPDKVMSYHKKNRVDLTDEWICTIDGEDAKDLDDAISIKRTDQGYQLGVHIADVSYYVTENSAIDQEAYVRGTSVYVVDRVVPMLPHHLSNGICSLHPDVDRLTISCVMDFNHRGEITDYKVFPSVIRSKNRMTYTNVNKILNGDEEMTKRYEEHADDFFLMLELSRKIRYIREQRGAIDFDTTESKIVVDQNGKVLDICRRERYEAERIIEDFMISANECVAEMMRHLELPFLYRIHEQPEAQKIREFAKIAKLMGYQYKGSANNVHVKDYQKILDQAKGSETYPVLSMWMLRSMSKARYDVNCVGHFGLASENYTHFTSPIRRYPDLIVHRMLRKYIFEGETDPEVIHNDAVKMEDIAEQSSSRERAAVDAERAVEAMKKAEFFEDKIRMQFDGVISSVTNFGLFVELENTVEGLVHIQNMNDDYYTFDARTMSLIGEHTGQIYKLGQKVRIRVKNASKKNSAIDFELVKTKRSNHPSQRKKRVRHEKA